MPKEETFYYKGFQSRAAETAHTVELVAYTALLYGDADPALYRAACMVQEVQEEFYAAWEDLDEIA